MTAKKPVKKKSRRREVAHLHVVVDPELLAKLEARARELDPRTANLSSAVRALLRSALGLPSAVVV